jgi:hypothetical protein
MEKKDCNPLLIAIVILERERNADVSTSNSSSSEGRSKPTSNSYRNNWDTVFGKQTVGQA